jgi:hypothetical protein
VPFGLNGEPEAFADPPGVFGFWLPQVLFGAPGCPGPLGLGVAAANPTNDKSSAAEATPKAILVILRVTAGPSEDELRGPI